MSSDDGSVVERKEIFFLCVNIIFIKITSLTPPYI